MSDKVGFPNAGSIATGSAFALFYLTISYYLNFEAIPEGAKQTAVVTYKACRGKYRMHLEDKMLWTAVPVKIIALLTIFFSYAPGDALGQDYSPTKETMWPLRVLLSGACVFLVLDPVMQRVQKTLEWILCQKTAPNDPLQSEKRISRKYTLLAWAKTLEQTSPEKFGEFFNTLPTDLKQTIYG